MILVSRFHYLNSEYRKQAQLNKRELGDGFIYSSVDKHKRGKGVFDTGLQIQGCTDIGETCFQRTAYLDDGQAVFFLHMQRTVKTEDAGISVRDLQEVFGFATPQAIYKWQHGVTLPTIDNLVVLAAVLGVKIDDILVMKDAQIVLSA